MSFINSEAGLDEDQSPTSSAPQPIFNFREHPYIPYNKVTNEEVVRIKAARGVDPRFSRYSLMVTTALCAAIVYSTGSYSNETTKVSADEAIESPVRTPINEDLVPEFAPVPIEIFDLIYKEHPENLHIYKGVSNDGISKFQVFIDDSITKGDFGPNFGYRLSILLTILNNKVDSNALALLKNSNLYISYDLLRSTSEPLEKFSLYYSGNPETGDFYPAYEVKVASGFSVERREVVSDLLHTYLNSALIFSNGSEKSVQDIHTLRLAIVYANSNAAYENLLPEVSSLLSKEEYTFLVSALQSDINIEDPNLN